MKLPYKLYLGDCLEILKTKPENSIDAIVTDPPYGLGFMGKKWDKIGDTSANYTNLDKPHISQEKFPMNKSRGRPISETDGKAQQKWHYKWAKEALRVAKPGAFLLAFGGTRTSHRLTCALENAGWEIRDCIMWVYGSGFPKSLDIGKAIDKKLGNKRKDLGKHPNARLTSGKVKICKKNGLGRLSKGESEWKGWGTALKPAWEPIIVARKPIEGTVVDNIIKYRTGGINIDKCRVEYDSNTEDFGEPNSNYENKIGGFGFYKGAKKQIRSVPKKEGRFPANLIHNGSPEVLTLFPDTISGKGNGNADGSAARFFYCAKTSKSDREKFNEHVTVKPTDLMRYLVKLVTPPKGRILDLFMGSGSTGKAAILEDFKFIGIEQEEKSFLTAKKRLKKATEKQALRLFR